MILTVFQAVLWSSIINVALSQLTSTLPGSNSSMDATGSEPPIYSNTTSNPWDIKITYGIDWQSKGEFGAWFNLVPSKDLNDLWSIYIKFPSISQDLVESSKSKSAKDDNGWFSLASSDDNDLLKQTGRKVWIKGKFNSDEGNPLPERVLFETVSPQDKSKPTDRAFIQLSYDIPNDIPNAPTADYLKVIPPKSGRDMTKIIIAVVVVVVVLALAILGFVLWRVYRPSNAQTKPVTEYDYSSQHHDYY